MQVPVIPTDNSTAAEESTVPVVTVETSGTAEETRMHELLKDDDREGHEV